MKDINNNLRREKEILLQTYNRIPQEISHGEGVYLISKDGKKYLDFFSGLAVNALGYGNTKIISSIEEQIKKYIHLSNYYINEPQIELAERLVKYSGLSKVFFANSGTEAIEASLKLIRKQFGPDKKIITFSNAFHGRTYGSLSLSGKEKYKKQFAPFLDNIIQLEFNNIKQLESNISKDTAAVYIEFIQGEGGIRITSSKFAKKLEELKKKYGFIIVADEVQSGIGRTGKPFAFNHFKVKPDLVISAKAIGGGLPLGALITNKKYSSVFQTGDHGSTFGGNPVACAAGLVVIKEVFENGLMDSVEKLGNYFISNLDQIKFKFPDKIKEVRGLGFMLGVELKFPCNKIVNEFREKGILVNCTSESVIRILPPLIATKKDIDHFLTVFEELLNKTK
ncbi:MAG: acetylornithine/succinylornithine family transaminase [Ignavibacteriaceae bacterium]